METAGRADKGSYRESLPPDCRGRWVQARVDRLPSVQTLDAQEHLKPSNSVQYLNLPLPTFL